MGDEREQDPELMSVADRIAAAHALDCPAGTRRWYWPRDIETRPCTCGAEERGASTARSRNADLLIRGSVDATIWKHRLHRGDDIERFYTAGREAGREAGGRYLEEER